MIFPTQYRVPAYNRWLLHDADLAPAYRWHRLFLQHLQCLTLAVQKELVSVLRNTAHGFRLVCTTTEDLELLVDERPADCRLRRSRRETAVAA